MTAQPHPQEPAIEEVSIDPEIAEHWEIWSRVIGTMALPRLERLQREVPEIRSVTLCTADGMNLCSLGVSQEDVGRLAALNSSLYAIASSQAEIVSEGAASPTQTMVSLSTGRGHAVLTSFVQPPLGQLLLSVSADSAQLGFLVVRAREAAAGIQQWLAEEQVKQGLPGS
ncbi:roadblock/LC7 domain-containing protein [Micrococcus sp.]|uniref:roadblock/LC7 domain-containing protein n=1 Tax=Micrococcus sp. TaxID=1271 RepID=UPI002A90EE3E|nr:roadblock/LC7 domain-containing protein [Micrococcus sp.]MDY6054901.1 roadblock/LC7 domain-containing protein [Micrococcus sp.]